MTNTYLDEDDPDYLMDHTIVLFLLNPENKVQEYFTQSKSPGQIIFETHNGKFLPNLQKQK